MITFLFKYCEISITLRRKGGVIPHKFIVLRENDTFVKHSNPLVFISIVLKHFKDNGVNRIPGEPQEPPRVHNKPDKLIGLI